MSATGIPTHWPGHDLALGIGFQAQKCSPASGSEPASPRTQTRWSIPISARQSATCGEPRRRTLAAHFPRQRIAALTVSLNV